MSDLFDFVGLTRSVHKYSRWFWEIGRGHRAKTHSSYTIWMRCQTSSCVTHSTNLEPWPGTSPRTDGQWTCDESRPAHRLVKNKKHDHRRPGAFLQEAGAEGVQCLRGKRSSTALPHPPPQCRLGARGDKPRSPTPSASLTGPHTHDCGAHEHNAGSACNTRCSISNANRHLSGGNRRTAVGTEHAVSRKAGNRPCAATLAAQAQQHITSMRARAHTHTHNGGRRNTKKGRKRGN